MTVKQLLTVLIVVSLVGSLFAVHTPEAKAGAIYNIPASITADCSVDVTSSVQAWMDSVPDNSTLLFGKDACYNVDAGLSVNDRNNIVLDGNGSTFKVFSQGNHDRANWTIRSGSNITFQNMIVYGADQHAGLLYDDAYNSNLEGQHAFRFEGTQGGLVQNTQAYNVWGDFVEAEPDWRVSAFPGQPVTNLVVQNNHFEHNGRMGIGLTHVDGFTFQNNYIGDIRWSAIDLELDASSEVGKNISIIGNHFGPINHHVFSNAGAGASPNIQNITIKDNVMDQQLVTCLEPINIGETGYERDNWTITNNILRPSHGAAAIITTQVGNVNFSNNTIYSGVVGGCTNTQAMTFNGSHDLTVSNNQIYGTYPQVYVADSASSNIASTGNLINALSVSNPLLTLATPSSNATVSGNVNLTTALTSDMQTVPLYAVKYMLDYNAQIGASSSVGPSFPVVWGSSSATNGKHTISAYYYYSQYGFVHSPGVVVTINNVAPPADTTAPTISISAPSSSAIISGASVPLSANAADNIGVVGVQFQVDGANYGTELSASPYVATLDSTKFSNGTHTITAIARDAAGNTTTSSAVRVDVENVQTPVTPPGSTGGSTGGGVVSVPTPSPTDSGTSSNAGNSGANGSGFSNTPPVVNFIKNKLVNDSGTFYLILNNVKRGVTDPGMLASYGYEFKDAQTIQPSEKTLLDGGPLLPGNGALVKSPEDKTVYFISGGQKHGFTSEAVFFGQGFRFSSVLTVTAPELDKLAVGSIISDPNAAHLQGTNISYEGTIYWIGGIFRHPYSSITIYNEWNKDNDFSAVVPANQADIQKQQGDTVVERVQG